MSEQTAQTPLIQAQSTAMARAMARICNAEQGCLGGMSGHERFALKLSGLAQPGSRSGRSSNSVLSTTVLVVRATPGMALIW